MKYKIIRYKMKHYFNKGLQILKDIEPLFRVLEVIVVCFGVVYVSIKANDIAEKELALDMLAIQPVFEIVQTFEESDYENIYEKTLVESGNTRHA